MAETDLNIILKLKDQLTATNNKIMNQFKGGWTDVAAKFYLAEKALTSFARTVSYFTSEAIKQEDAIKRMNIALEIQGTYSEGLSKQYQDLAEAIQKNTRYADDAIEEAMQTLISVGNVVPNQMNKAIQATIDFASATGTDLSTAAMTVAKASAGSTAALSRYGIIIDENTPKSERFAKTLEYIEKRFGGTAQADVDTYSGKLAKMSNTLGDLRETVGKIIIDSEELNNVIRGMTVAIDSINKAFSNNSKGNAVDAFLRVSPLARVFSLIAESTKKVREEVEMTLPTIVVTAEKVSKLEEIWGEISEHVAIGIDHMSTKYSSWTSELERMTERVVASMTDTFGDFFYSAFKGQLNDAGDMVRAFGDSVLRILSQTLAQVAMFGTSGKGGILGTIFSGMSALGGLGSLGSAKIIAGGLMSSSDALLKAAPIPNPVGNLSILGAFATGTEYVPRNGLYQLHRGEKIQNPHESSREQSGGSITIINVIDPAMVPTAMASEQGKRVIINTISNDYSTNGTTRKVIRK